MFWCCCYYVFEWSTNTNSFKLQKKKFIKPTSSKWLVAAKVAKDSEREAPSVIARCFGTIFCLRTVVLNSECGEREYMLFLLLLPFYNISNFPTNLLIFYMPVHPSPHFIFTIIIIITIQKRKKNNKKNNKQNKKKKLIE